MAGKKPTTPPTLRLVSSTEGTATPPPTDTGGPDDPLSPERVRLALWSFFETADIAAALVARMDELEPEQLHMRALFLRLRDLASIGMSALSDISESGLREAQIRFSGKATAAE